MKSIKADASSVSPSSLISSDLGLTLERSALKLFTVANAHYQLSWNPQKSLQIKWQILCSFINCGVIQGFPGPEKSRNNTREKISYFSRVCVDTANQLLTRHSPLVPLGQVDEWTAKPSRFLMKVLCRDFLELWRLKHKKISYRWQTLRFKIF